MRIVNPEYIRRIDEFANRCPYFGLLSMRILEVGIGYSVIGIEVAQKHLQPFGKVHGGVFASILDAAAFWSVYYDLEEADGLTTVDLKLNYLAPASAGMLIAKGRRIKTGKTLGYAEAEVANGEGKVLAHGTSTVIVLPGKAPVLDPPLPPKFLS